MPSGLGAVDTADSIGFVFSLNELALARGTTDVFFAGRANPSRCRVASSNTVSIELSADFATQELDISAFHAMTMMDSTVRPYQSTWREPQWMCRIVIIFLRVFSWESCAAKYFLFKKFSGHQPLA